jgi:hypothetical protein
MAINPISNNNFEVFSSVDEISKELRAKISRGDFNATTKFKAICLERNIDIFQAVNGRDEVIWLINLLHSTN